MQTKDNALVGLLIIFGMYVSHARSHSINTNAHLCSLSESTSSGASPAADCGFGLLDNDGSSLLRK